MKHCVIVLACAGALGTTGALAQVRGEIVPARGVAETGGLYRVGIDVDMLKTGKLLGSYGAVLRWDPAVLQYASDSGGQSPFSGAVVNRTATATGTLRFSAAAPEGAPGHVNVFNVTFRAVARSCVNSFLDLEFTSLSTALTFENLLPQLTVVDGTVSIIDESLNLMVNDEVATILTWDAVPGAVTYDAIRGRLGGMSQDAVTIHLGQVVCVENDSLDTTTGEGSEPAHPDTESPALGTGFFYLVRFNDGFINGGYGFSQGCERQRVADGGDCP